MQSTHGSLLSTPLHCSFEADAAGGGCFLASAGGAIGGAGSAAGGILQLMSPLSPQAAAAAAASVLAPHAPEFTPAGGIGRVGAGMYGGAGKCEKRVTIIT